MQAGATVVAGRARAPAVHRPSCSTAITSAGAAEVIVLPNDHDSIAVAEAAARAARAETGIRVAVIADPRPGAGAGRRSPSTSPAAPFDDDVVEMTAAAAARPLRRR